MVPTATLSYARQYKLKKGECLGPKKAQLIHCTVVLYDKGGTIQWAGCLRVCVHIDRLELLCTRSYDLTQRVINFFEQAIFRIFIAP